MKAKRSPEKIYIFEQDFQRKDHKVMYGVNQDKDIKGLIEYTRTDAFIEKAKEWFKAQTIFVDLEGNSHWDEQPFEDFKNAMK